MTQTSDRRDESLSLEYQACRDVMDNYEMAEPGEMNVVRFTGYAMMDSWRAGYDRGIAAERARSKILVEALEFYADERNWNNAHDCCFDRATEDVDTGDRASEALATYNGTMGGGDIALKRGGR